jgi:hypothetical protein
MDANVVGMIEIENGLCANLQNTAEGSLANRSELEQSLACLDHDLHELLEELPSAAPARSGNYRTYQTRFLRADLNHLHDELQQTFEALLVRLFEAE